jgi:hypothetical protein
MTNEEKEVLLTLSGWCKFSRNINNTLFSKIVDNNLIFLSFNEAFEYETTNLSISDICLKRDLKDMKLPIIFRNLFNDKI